MYKEYIEMIWFFAGVFVYRTIATILTYGHMANFVKDINIQALKMLGTVAEDTGFIREMKYGTLSKSGIEEDEIDKVREIDDRTFHMWKAACVTRMLINCPKIYRHTLKFSDWKEAMQELDRQYKIEAKLRKF